MHFVLRLTVLLSFQAYVVQAQQGNTSFFTNPSGSFNSDLSPPASAKTLTTLAPLNSQNPSLTGSISVDPLSRLSPRSFSNERKPSSSLESSQSIDSRSSSVSISQSSTEAITSKLSSRRPTTTSFTRGGESSSIVETKYISIGGSTITKILTVSPSSNTSSLRSTTNTPVPTIRPQKKNSNQSKKNRNIGIGVGVGVGVPVVLAAIAGLAYYLHHKHAAEANITSPDDESDQLKEKFHTTNQAANF